MSELRMAVVLAAVLTVLFSCAGPPPAPEGNASRGVYEKTPDGAYRVRKGDSLYTIGFRFGLDWREIARINSISTPYTIYPDQVLKLVTSASSSTAGQPSTMASGVQTVAAPASRSATTRALDAPASPDAPVDPAPAAELPATSAQVAGAAPPLASGAGNSAGTQAPAGGTYSAPAGDPKRWLWPSEGRLLSAFKAGDPLRKGIDIAGRLGQDVVASAAGQVVYSGSGLLGYGELIIIKHSDRMLSAYAHNQRRLVSEGQQVIAGSKIAEMGTNDRNQVVLHFEIRVNGTPQDPLKFLPQR